MTLYYGKFHNDRWVMNGFKDGINQCCILFFESAWRTLSDEVPEYSDKMYILTDNAGVILCPDCLVSTMDPKHDDL